MRITEILYSNNEPSETHRLDPQLGQSPPSFSDDPTNLANAFTRSGLVKSFWNLNGSEDQFSGPAPPNPETELIPSAHWSRLRRPCRPSLSSSGSSTAVGAARARIGIGNPVAAPSRSRVLTSPRSP
jgi:hypothetical protein